MDAAGPGRPSGHSFTGREKLRPGGADTLFKSSPAYVELPAHEVDIGLPLYSVRNIRDSVSDIIDDRGAFEWIVPGVPHKQRALEIHEVLLIPRYVNLMIYTALLDSNASEHAARMVAMQTATDNADELLRLLNLQYNKSRQQAITSELLDIVGGSVNN